MLELPGPGCGLASFQLFDERSDIQAEDANQSQYSMPESKILQQHQAKRHNTDDVNWSICSNAFFVTGCTIYLITALWDLHIYSQPNGVEDLHAVLGTPQYILYKGLWIVAPLVYFLNSSIDVRWAMIVRERVAREKKRSLRRSHLEAKLNATPQHHTRKRFRINTVLKRPRKLVRRMRKHIGHRRQVGASSFFGLAALLSIIAELFGLLVTEANINQDSKDTLAVWVGWLESGSIHICLVSACLALWVSPWKISENNAVEPISVKTPWNSSIETLETLGDVLFGAAAIVDVCLQNSTFDDGIYWWPVLSATLCFFDSLFYLIGDIATLYNE